ncbi:SLC13 family permease [Rhodococcoides corynebacterioides]|uniref:Arsenic transporter n=1 Tax=Rhodococcoides corynebacterioides TaxID=53972 RepID=A0ABS7P815_9NOCA|nr:SLC13 family permease [Rhodococcus corynebacterioides]MBY6367311.1 arsenic transporter [Rhodococcus corynebacterioides]MBY6408961.1 arsenic transporter [Rhodococcus corynebacterioides]
MRDVVLPVLLVGAVLAFAIVRPRGLPEAVLAVPAAGLALLLGVVGLDGALREVRDLAPTVAFLAAILALAHLADRRGVFRWIAGVLHRRSASSPVRLLAAVFVTAALTTAVLSLDATVVLLTPVVIAAARRAGFSARPTSYAVAHLSNSASTLLPVSNLTNLLVFSATGLSFLHFSALMAGPWVVAIVVEFLVFRWFFRNDLRGGESSPEPADLHAGDTPDDDTPAPVFALGVIACALVGFAVSGAVGIEPVWVAAAAAVVLAVPAVRAGDTGPTAIVRALDLWFCVFVFALGIVVAGLADGPVGSWVADLLPASTSLPSLLLIAAIAAVASNVLNNLPATLLLLAALTGSGAASVPALLALLIGVNLGPNLTYVGSLAIMLWRRVARAEREPVSLRTFTVLGVLTTPVTLVAATLALWAALRV